MLYEGPDCRVERDYNGVAWLWLDCADAATNTLPMSTLGDLHNAIDAVKRFHGLRGLIIGSAKPAGFVAGADTGELGRMHDHQHVRALMKEGHALTQRIAKMRVPTVALIHGHCLGSGLELALACRYRVVDEAASTALGLPDVRLGIHPCHGATARLPVVVGAWRALDLLISGRSVDPVEASRMGLVDATVPRDDLADAGLRLLRHDPGEHRPGLAVRALNLLPARWLVYQIHNSRLQREARPENFPATYALLRLWRDAGGASTEGRMEAERRSLIDLISQPSALNLVRTYLLQNRLKREARSLNVDLPATVHVRGSDGVATGVAGLLALHGRGVVVHAADDGTLASLREQADALFRARLGDDEPVRAAQERLVIRSDDEGLESSGLVIETGPDDPQARSAALADLETRVPAECIIAATTVTCLVESLASGMTQPQRLVGVHFFPPVERMPLVEVVVGQGTGEAAVQTGQALVAAMDKLPIRVASTPGFLVNRMQLPYILEGAKRYERARREIIDTAALRFGMPIGPLELADSLGLDVCKELAEKLDYPVPEPLGDLVAAGHLGQWHGRGFHDWKRGRRVTASVPPGEHMFEALARELIGPLVTEAARCRDEGVAADADLVDTAALFGAGFPAYTGGPLTFLRERGWGDDEPAQQAR